MSSSYQGHLLEGESNSKNENEPAHTDEEVILDIGNSTAQTTAVKRFDNVDSPKPNKYISISLLLLLLIQIGYSIAIFCYVHNADLSALFIIANILRIVFIGMAYAAYRSGATNLDMKIVIAIQNIIYFGSSVTITVGYWFYGLSIADSSLLYSEVLFNTIHSIAVGLVFAYGICYAIYREIRNIINI